MSSYLRLMNICKSYNDIPILKNISLSLEKGEVLGLLGKNGTGKTLLVNIISGAVQRDSGEIFIEDRRVAITNPIEAKKHEISVIHETPNLIESLSVAENIFFGSYPKMRNKVFQRLGRINWREIYHRANLLCEQYDYNIDVKTKVRDIGIGEKHIVEILKAVSQNSKILIMDEPTSGMTENDIVKLFNIIREMRKSGVSIIFTTHNIDDVYRIADRVLIINDGEIVKDELVINTQANDIIRCMAGKDIKNRYPKLISSKSKELLKVEGLTSKDDQLKDISFTLKSGEVLGVTGLMKSGKSSISSALAGEKMIKTGEFFIKGKPVCIKGPIDASNNRISFIPENRMKSAIFPNESIINNITIARLKGVENEILKWVIDEKYEFSRVESYANRLAIKRNSIMQEVKSLSSGNQQKVLFARCVFADADILLLDEPTKSIDIAGKVEVYNIINELTREGKGIILISSDFSEIMGMCDRILIMHDGGFIKQLSREEATKEKILYYACGAQ
ncbi:sugar ABC transporter ATP-binding protein [Petroclostridium sp. X23]|uniref:sugar ABC transporter ATP-binding protein n=1 Tax=Petroclostridium sp. X23 TaxID=3045146 RepID=UPI0024ADA45A|nr:sugar ABC transporter ATP-binding protein [Petroclostridium sp. X23]WHH57270.1 sugar ABC transporter ATP-binding protein [Petroclostridium sp. X23]